MYYLLVTKPINVDQRLKPDRDGKLTEIPQTPSPSPKGEGVQGMRQLNFKTRVLCQSAEQIY